MVDVQGSAPTNGKRRGSRGGLSFLAGLVLGGAAALLLPPLVRPYVPSVVRGEATALTGSVEAKRVESDRLLLTIDTPGGAILATFTAEVPEIDLLVGEGDSVTLLLETYSPFAHDPEITRVRKQGKPALAGEEASEQGLPEKPGQGTAGASAPGDGAEEGTGAETPEDSAGPGDRQDTVPDDSLPSNGEVSLRPDGRPALSSPVSLPPSRQPEASRVAARAAPSKAVRGSRMS